MKQIDINCDLGESFGNYIIGNDEKMMPFISSANIACGFHAGDPVVIERTVKLALQNNVKIGAHPGYPDLQGFGRRSVKMSPEEIRTSMLYQIAALKGISESLGGILHHIKPHGALYNDAAYNPEIAKAIISAIRQIDPKLKLYALSGSPMVELAKQAGLQTASEVFADRAYEPNGQLVSRKKEGAVIYDVELCKQGVLRMISDKKVEAINGEIVSINAETVCIHGDNPAALKMAKELYNFLSENNIEIKAS